MDKSNNKKITLTTTKKKNINYSKKKKNYKKSQGKRKVSVKNKQTIIEKSKNENNLNQKIIVELPQKEKKNIESINKENIKERITKTIQIKDKFNIKEKIKIVVKKIFNINKMILIPVAIIIIIIIIFFIKDNVKEVLSTFSEYKIGQEVKLSDDSLWYVIEDSHSNDSKVKLLSSSIIDINGDKKIDENDKVSFDSNGIYKYSTVINTNIGFYINKNIKEILKKIKGISSIRLMTSKEYINVRNKLGLGYSWDKENWLAGPKISEWWLETSNNDSIYVITKKGTYKMVSPSNKKYIRPVIIVNKEKVK